MDGHTRREGRNAPHAEFTKSQRQSLAHGLFMAIRDVHATRSRHTQPRHSSRGTWWRIVSATIAPVLAAWLEIGSLYTVWAGSRRKVPKSGRVANQNPLRSRSATVRLANPD